MEDFAAIQDYHNSNNIPVNYNQVLTNLDDLEDHLDDASDTFKDQNKLDDAAFLEKRLDTFDNLEDHIETHIGQDRKKRSAFLDDLRAIHEYHTNNNIPSTYYTWNNVLTNLDELQDHLDDAQDNYEDQRQYANAGFLDRRLDELDPLEDNLEYHLGHDRKK